TVYEVVDPKAPTVRRHLSDDAPFPVSGLGPTYRGDVVCARIAPVGGARHALGVVLRSGGGWNVYEPPERRDVARVLEELVHFTRPPTPCDFPGPEQSAVVAVTVTSPVAA